MLIFLINHSNSPSKKQPVHLNLISPGQSFSFKLFMAQKYMYYRNPLRPRWRFVGGWIIASSTMYLALNLSIPDVAILIMGYQVSLMMSYLTMVDSSVSFLLLSNWIYFWWTSRGDHSKKFLLFELCCGTPPSWFIGTWLGLGLEGVGTKGLGTGLDNWGR